MTYILLANEDIIPRHDISDVRGLCKCAQGGANRDGSYGSSEAAGRGSNSLRNGEIAHFGAYWRRGGGGVRGNTPAAPLIFVDIMQAPRCAFAGRK